jgi:aspartate/methionine/tyrosine aminotransferase
MTTRYPFALIREKLAAQGEALDFAIGQCHIRVPEAIDQWIRGNPELAMKPASGTDIRAFKEAAAGLLRREYDVDLEADHILPTPGGRAAMSAFVASVLEPGDRVLLTEPGYPAFARLATHRHAKILELELDPDNDFAPEPISDSQVGSEAARVIALNYPNNPTGATLSSETMAVLRTVIDRGTILFNDATYGPLVYDSRPTSLLCGDIVGDSQIEAVELHSFSKLFPIGPAAVSFLAGSDDTMHKVSTYSEFAWSPLSSLQVRATALCLKDPDRLRELRESFPKRLRRLRRALIDLGFEPRSATAGVYLICRKPRRINGKAVSTAMQAAEVLMDDFDIAVVPWDTQRHGYLRFSSLYLPEDLRRLEELCGRLKVG